MHPTNGVPTVTDGTFQYTQDQVGTFCVVEAESIDEAVEIAPLHPGAHLGQFFGSGIEVRPGELFEEYTASSISSSDR
ncbi:MAG: YciI family protein [Armatimonas sp.]